MSWTPTDASQAINPRDLNGGIVVADYEHELGGRIILENIGDPAHFAVTCGIYGWFFHTCRFSTREDAESACNEMQTALDRILISIPQNDDPERDSKCAAVSASISEFVDIFP